MSSKASVPSNILTKNRYTSWLKWSVALFIILVILQRMLLGYLQSPKKKSVTILLWNTYFYNGDNSLAVFLEYGPINAHHCKYDPESIIMTADRSALGTASAVIFHGFRHNLFRNDMPETHPSDQLWVFYTMEPPGKTANLTDFNDVFNLTWSYRRDSDIWAPSGIATPWAYPENADEILPKISNGLMVAVMSNCWTKSRREWLIELLQERGNITVDVYGDCGIPTCGKFERSSRCNFEDFWKDLGKRYKFYFAAENSLCRDYITEKFWRTLRNGMVPVVYGGGNYVAEAPPHSFIDVNEFPTVEKLAEYLTYLDNNDTAYMEYFEWRKSFTIEEPNGWSGWCMLCSLLLQRNSETSDDSRATNDLRRYQYGNIQEWWDGDGVCKMPQFTE